MSSNSKLSHGCLSAVLIHRYVVSIIVILLWPCRSKVHATLSIELATVVPEFNFTRAYICNTPRSNAFDSEPPSPQLTSTCLHSLFQILPFVNHLRVLPSFLYIRLIMQWQSSSYSRAPSSSGSPCSLSCCGKLGGVRSGWTLPQVWRCLWG